MLLRFIKQLTIADWIQIFILCALIWYSIETHLLRKEQKRLTYLNILQLYFDRRGPNAITSSNYPNWIRRIIKYGSFNVDELYVKGPKLFRYKWMEKIYYKLRSF